MREHVECVESVLREFFQLSPEGWKNARCDAELARMREKQAKARASAEASVKARRTNAQRTLNGRSTDVELPTPTPIPIPIPTPTPEDKDMRTQSVRNNARARRAVDCPPDVAPKVFDDWLEVRKAKRAGPVTQTVLDGIRREAQKAGITLQAAIEHCCLSGWQGFKADWYLSRPAAKAEKFDPVAYVNRNRISTQRIDHEHEHDIIDITPERLA
jgi:hypothetical protein